MSKLRLAAGVGGLPQASQYKYDGTNEAAFRQTVEQALRTLAAASIDSIDSDVLGSGTPDATKFLRGDRTWAVPVGLIAGLTTGTLPKASSATALADSILSESGNLLAKKASTGIVLALDTTGTGDTILDFKNNGTEKWQAYVVGADGSIRFFSVASGLDRLILTSTKPSVTGSRGGNAALASLLTTLANMGLITDSTTA